ncbi:hypothetical protein B0H14DRAFT_3577057 [Mycena olivaceomarginata]|nr:hypothetical protein B0H14DRAFT_3577057 [Mycena olivaceomarginata]
MAESPRVTRFAFSNTQFQAFILAASRRLMTDRFLTTDYTAAIYMQDGLDYIDKSKFRAVNGRTVPELNAPSIFHRLVCLAVRCTSWLSSPSSVILGSFYVALGLSTPVSSLEGIGNTYNYIAIGGSLARLTVAGCLSEILPSACSLSKPDDRDYPAVFEMYEFSVAEDAALGWHYLTRVRSEGRRSEDAVRKQRLVDARIRGAIQLWSTLLEESEGRCRMWDKMLHYTRKSEKFMLQTPDQVAKAAESILAVDGLFDAVRAAFSHGMYSGPPQRAFIASATNTSGVVHCPQCWESELCFHKSHLYKLQQR